MLRPESRSSTDKRLSRPLSSSKCLSKVAGDLGEMAGESPKAKTEGGGGGIR